MQILGPITAVFLEKDLICRQDVKTQRSSITLSVYRFKLQVIVLDANWVVVDVGECYFLLRYSSSIPSISSLSNTLCVALCETFKVFVIGNG